MSDQLEHTRTNTSFGRKMSDVQPLLSTQYSRVYGITMCIHSLTLITAVYTHSKLTRTYVHTHTCTPSLAPESCW